MFTYIDLTDLILIGVVILAFMALVYKAGVDQGRRQMQQNTNPPQSW